MRNVLSAEEAAKRLECSPQTVRERLRRGIWTFGRAFNPKVTGLTQWIYEVYEDQLETFLGEKNNGDDRENL